MPRERLPDDSDIPGELRATLLWLLDVEPVQRSRAVWFLLQGGAS